MHDIPELTRAQVLSFRLARMHLDQPLAPEDALRVFDCAMQDSPPGSCARALHLRVPEGPTLAALLDQRALEMGYAMRHAPFAFRSQDAAIFARGLMPCDDADLLTLAPFIAPVFAKQGLSMYDFLRDASEAFYALLSNGEMLLNDAPRALAGVLPAKWAMWLNGSRNEMSGDMLMRYLAPTGCFLHAGRVRTHLLLKVHAGYPAFCEGARDDALRAELLRRFMRRYAPATAIDFALWAHQVDVKAYDQLPECVRRAWETVLPELAPARCEGREGWAFPEDVDAMRAARMPEGVRMLAPRDPYTAQRPRDWLLPDAKLQKVVWPVTVPPGVLLRGGAIAGIWTMRKNGKKLTFSAEWFTPALPGEAEWALARAEALANAEGCVLARKQTITQTAPAAPRLPEPEW